MDRIIPPDEDPGAMAAGASDFLLRLLSGPDFVLARPDGSGFLHLTGKLAGVWRARLRTWRRLYRDGASELDRRAREIYRRAFADLSSAEQDAILKKLSLDVVWSEFFELLLQHTREAYYGDPVYGGNLNHVGWQAIGFRGPASLHEVHSGKYGTEAYFEPVEKRP
jgi:gluconate 2-dehydrogenase gamma chain